MDKVHAKAQGSQPGHTLKPVLGPLSMRDALVILGGVLVLVGSLIPIPWNRSVSVNMWIFPGLPFHLFVSLLLPLGIAAGFLWRRLTGRTRVRVASLSLDQAGSVVALFAAAYFFNSYVASMSPAYLIGLLGALAMIAGTTLATYLGIFRRDFVSGGDSVLGADVHPVALAPKESAVKKAESTDGQAAEAESESFGASSAGGAGTASARRPGTPGPNRSEGHRESASASAPVAVAGAGAAAAAAGVAVPAPAPVKDSPAPEQESTPAATQRRGSEAAASVTADKDADSAEPASVKPEAPHAQKAEARDGQQAHGTSDDVNQDQANAAHPLTEWKSVAEAKAGHQSESASAAETGAGTRTDAQAAYADSLPSTQDAEPQDAATDSAAENPSKPEVAGAASGIAAVQGAGRSGSTDADATSGRDPKPAAADKAPEPEPPAATGADAGSNQSAHPSTMATPLTGADIKATAALSRADIAAHQAAVERAKAESESSFGAKAEVHDHDGHDGEAASFWFALNHPRPVFHPANGTMLSTAHPGVWILCLEDRGTEYLISLADGRQAVLRNLDDLQFPDK
ncbi:hypothetical protein [Paeniglutamicibacter sulfureus]|uniref:Uncharacterized protein n=1 Tax=Paeniglutamicibacter sulfureus TaxID=43666 RepID=A0ABU2BMV2_9MICC|nr:hypothetical protein [Paeniglutamicibacter sulfureus]MDR7359616.1 hypothetical protein [Paeniglutamicibacter sulfureus]